MRMKNKKNKKTEDTEKVSKLTKIILNDLKGPRVVRHNFSENKIERNFSENKIIRKIRAKQELSIRKRQNDNWNMIWKTLVVCAAIDLALLGYFRLFENKGFFEGLEGWSIATRNLIYGEKANTIQPIITGKKYNNLPINKKIVEKHYAYQPTNKKISKSTNKPAYCPKTKPS